MPSVPSFLIVAIGGALGSAFRYLFGTWVQALSRSIDFSYGRVALALNPLVCFVIGFLAQLAETRGAFTSEARSFVFIVIQGGFTTLSSFANDSVNLMREGQLLNSLANVGANVILGLILVWLGRTPAYWIWR
jgi:CrcB protein